MVGIAVEDQCDCMTMDYKLRVHSEESIKGEGAAE